QRIVVEVDADDNEKAQGHDAERHGGENWTGGKSCAASVLPQARPGARKIGPDSGEHRTFDIEGDSGAPAVQSWMSLFVCHPERSERSSTTPLRAPTGSFASLRMTNHALLTPKAKR